MAPTTCTISLTVNGHPHVAEVEPRRLLVDFLREDLNLLGTHIGCEHGVCGTCTVLLNGASIRSCITLAVQADGAEISTVEGLAPAGDLHASGQTRLDLARTYLRRGIELAMSRARNER